MEYPNSTLPLPHSLIIFFFNLSYRTQGDLEKNQAEMTHQIWPKRPRAEMTRDHWKHQEENYNDNDLGTLQY